MPTIQALILVLSFLGRTLSRKSWAQLRHSLNTFSRLILFRAWQPQLKLSVPHLLHLPPQEMQELWSHSPEAIATALPSSALLGPGDSPLPPSCGHLAATTPVPQGDPGFIKCPGIHHPYSTDASQHGLGPSLRDGPGCPHGFLGTVFKSKE